MDDGELDFSDHEEFSRPDLVTQFSMSSSMDTFMDEVLKKNSHTCTHTHTCNPSGPDNAHTHTCYHAHTQIISSEEEKGLVDKSEQCAEKKKRPLRNREAVRKYREKKKAHTAYLEEEVQKSRLLNQQLLRKLQVQAALEAEVARLRTLLVDFRGKIESELGFFPYRKPCSRSLKEGNCGVQPLNAGIDVHCETEVPCLYAALGTSQLVGRQNGDILPWEGICEITNPDCQGLKLNGDLIPHSLSPKDTVTAADCLMPRSMSISGSLEGFLKHWKVGSKAFQRDTLGLAIHDVILENFKTLQKGSIFPLDL